MKNILSLKDKKGFDFNLASGIVFGVVSLAIIIVIGLMVLNTSTELSDSNRVTFTYTNQSKFNGDIKFLNITGWTLAGINSTTSGYTIVEILGSEGQSNGSGVVGAGTIAVAAGGGYNETILVGNATVDANGLVTNSSTLYYPNVSITYSYTDQGSQEYLETSLKSNVTTGLNTVVAKFPTIFTVIAIAIVLAIVGFIIVIVRKIGFSGMSNSFGQ